MHNVEEFVNDWMHYVEQNCCMANRMTLCCWRGWPLWHNCTSWEFICGQWLQITIGYWAKETCRYMAGWSTAAVICLSGSVVYCSIVPHRSLCRQPMATAYTQLSRPTQPLSPSVRARSFGRTTCVGQQTRGVGVGKVGIYVTDGGLRSDWHSGSHAVNWLLVLCKH